MYSSNPTHIKNAVTISKSSVKFCSSLINVSGSLFVWFFLVLVLPKQKETKVAKMNLSAVVLPFRLPGLVAKV